MSAMSAVFEFMKKNCFFSKLYILIYNNFPFTDIFVIVPPQKILDRMVLVIWYNGKEIITTTLLFRSINDIQNRVSFQRR